MNEGVVADLNLTDAERKTQAALQKVAHREWQNNWDKLHPDAVTAKDRKYKQTHAQTLSDRAKVYHKTDKGKARYARNLTWRQLVINAKTHYCRPCDKAFWCKSHLERHCGKNIHRETVAALKQRATAARFLQPFKASTAATNTKQ
jgi:hypothetical protein